MGRLEFWEYSGEPTPEEIIHRLEDNKLHNHNTKLWIRHKCPNCGNRNTKWIRQEWSICFDCIIAFTLDDALGYYDVAEYEMDEREEEE